jgi:Na+-translocating ferredoxin:NAD+ oxidoreductase RnfG subunit
MNRLHPSYLLRPVTALLLAGLLAGWTGVTTATAQVAKSNKVTSLQNGLKEMLQKEGAKKLKKLTVTVDSDQSAGLKKEFGIEAAGSYSVYQGLDAEDKPMGSVVIVNEPGKEGPLQVIVAIRPDGQIYDIGFTIFGEDKGKPALSWGYLKQYMGKSHNDPLKLGGDIDGVSGATWTSTSVAAAVKRAVIVYETFVRTDD